MERRASLTYFSGIEIAERTLRSYPLVAIGVAISERALRRISGIGLALLVLSASGARAATPLQYFTGAGDKANAIVPLTWAVTIVSVVVILLIAALVAGAVWRRPGIALQEPGTRFVVGKEEGGTNWIWIGVGLSSVVLLASVVWTMAVLAQVNSPAGKTGVTIEVTGRQWWWQVRYLSNDPARIFTTANEIHIPTGVPVRVKLIGGDVIHSFWVPALTGKTDTIPGQTNETWMEASAPGTYYGQCTEYCGIEHAHMAFRVIAQSPADFWAWWAHQLQSPAQVSGMAANGVSAFTVHCASCHAVRGTDAAGILGPDLSHLMTRSTIASGIEPNDPAHLAALIADPQHVKPGILMQKPELSPDEFAAIRAYLATLN